MHLCSGNIFTVTDTHTNHIWILLSNCATSSNLTESSSNAKKIRNEQCYKHYIVFSNLIFSPDIVVITGPLSSAVLNPRFFGWAVFVFWLKLKLPAQAVKRGTRIQTPMLVWLFLWGHSLQLMHSQAFPKLPKLSNKPVKRMGVNREVWLLEFLRSTISPFYKATFSAGTFNESIHISVLFSKQ